MSGKKIVIVGATSSIAQHCARAWLAAGAAELVLLGRDAARLERVAADLAVRAPQAAIRVATTDFVDPAAIQATVDGIAAAGLPDIVLIAHGSLPDQSTCQNDLQASREALEVNAISPVLYAEAFVQHMARANRGTIAVIGSVAGDRGRKSNYVYGSAKGLVTRYVQGLQHRLAGTGVAVCLIKPGPTDTPMTAHMKGTGAKLAPVEQVATQIVSAVDRKRPVAYVPGKWAIIMMIIRHLPAFVFNKMNI
ncbi:SDR family NAD(P)-dependent oxidoreductase [Paraburkholderia acidisoli]|uniref:SDR family NAD(P)-dependent oxidoreductase n=1 Tax=Paraburkholderia acidisoli TaxID=2571748 RepID=A0A7Z2GG06_9BURK|nr:SDR family NAD(P)-dependent oxidoreductase [Paraburkholderia acidisoli]QGZ60809.1 SDR family NAD(P)-dependent oxidoreductase [Paraburkholderia acidisoli]